ncbi:TIM-barrel domain-containing protein [Aestuariivivens insulae]|uniref:TIM-barrel domain-containing protein n=1 Tax=Aestuariivivens insulae TaxID=1621988 RepID=UPI001F5A8FDF|nr:TIM-barrel domain-containing protein [Aestuariivivens insulae]
MTGVKLKERLKKVRILMVLFVAGIACYGQSARVIYDGYATKAILSKTTEVSFYLPTMFRVRSLQNDSLGFSKKYDIPFVIGHVEPWEKVEVNVRQEGISYFIMTERLTVEIDEYKGLLRVDDKAEQKRVYPSDGPVYGMFKDGYSMFDSASFFNEKNDNSRYAHWFYNPETKRYDIYLGEDAIMDSYFIYGPSYTGIYNQFNQLVGPEPLLPKKAFGFFQTQHLACHGNQTQLMEAARQLRRHDIPVDNLIIDFEWGDGCQDGKEIVWGSAMDWSESYSKPLSPKTMIDSLKAMHFDVMLIQHNAPDFKNRVGQGWTETVQPETLWWQKWKEKLDIGVRGTWQDTRRNDITDSRIWLGTQELLGDDNRVLFMGCRKMQAVNPWDFRYSVTPVNNIIGSRRYPFDWTGDCSFNWNELKWQIKAITNTHGALKGVSYISSDGVGETWQIQARWNQFSDFSAISRSHNPKPWAGNIDVANFQNKIKIEDRENVVVKETKDGLTHAVDGMGEGKTAENSIRKHRKERYKLLPYIYSTAFENYLTGMPMSRPMLIAFPDDYLCFSDTWPYQYMFGPNLLVAPVYGDFKTMEIYLPRGNDWIDYWSKEVYKDGGIINYNTEDVEKLPLFIKSGAMLPKIPERNWIEEGQQEEVLILEVYPTKSSASFTLYEDDSKTIAYQNGEYSKTLLSQKVGAQGELIITIGKAEGDYKNKLTSKKWIIKVLDVLNAYKSVSVNSKQSQFVKSANHKNTLFKEVVLEKLANEKATIVIKK